ncbi:MAG: hypothetical protein IKW20_06240, partial [Bacteroidales bacterium]|nr:hypothetical protein [Bacteroidales bacterium]
MKIIHFSDIYKRGLAKDLSFVQYYFWTGGEALGGSGRLWEALGGSGRLWEALGGSGRLWEALGGSGRLWEALGGSG